MKREFSGGRAISCQTRRWNIGKPVALVDKTRAENLPANVELSFSFAGIARAGSRFRNAVVTQRETRWNLADSFRFRVYPVVSIQPDRSTNGQRHDKLPLRRIIDISGRNSESRQRYSTSFSFPAFFLLRLFFFSSGPFDLRSIPSRVRGARAPTSSGFSTRRGMRAGNWTSWFYLSSGETAMSSQLTRPGKNDGQRGALANGDRSCVFRENGGRL